MDQSRTNVPANANAGCIGPTSESAGKASGCAGCPNQKLCASGQAKKEDPALGVVAENLEEVKHTILVLSGKGGVGKSTVSTQLAFSLARQGKQVGLLDIDLCGPSVPRMLGIVGESVHKSGSGWCPVYVNDNLAVMSIGFMMPDKDAAVIWRGPRKNGLIKQFLTDVEWGELDYLIIDTPPGTSDEHISMAQYLKYVNVDGAVVVTTPQEVSMADVRKELSFCHKTKTKVIGIIENMSGLQLDFGQIRFMDPATGTDCSALVMQELAKSFPDILKYKMVTEVFTRSGAGPEGMAAKYGVPFLGRIPLDASVGLAGDAGRECDPKHPAGFAFEAIVSNIRKRVEHVEEPPDENHDGGSNMEMEA